VVVLLYEYLMASWSAVQVPSTPKAAPVLPEPGLILCAVQETQPPGRLPFATPHRGLFPEALHDKEARGQQCCARRLYRLSKFVFVRGQGEARIGRPLTPGSVAGVHRRRVRRTYRRGSYYGGGYYPYSYHGGHYRCRYHGHYYNHRGYYHHRYRYWYDHRLVAASKLVIALGLGLQAHAAAFPCQHLCLFPCPNDHYRSGGREVSASAVPAHGGWADGTFLWCTPGTPPLRCSATSGRSSSQLLAR